MNEHLLEYVIEDAVRKECREQVATKDCERDTAGDLMGCDRSVETFL
jgi:hypothetical protein